MALFTINVTVTIPGLAEAITIARSLHMTLTELTAKVQANTTVTESAITLIQGLAQQLRDAATDPAAIQALADQLDAADSSLAAAVTANTKS